jgi:phage head maturation protease
MPSNDKREYRALNIRAIETGGEGPEYMVEGYASTFELYVLLRTDEGTEYKEQIKPTAFDEADL